jgi:cytochrome P450
MRRTSKGPVLDHDDAERLVDASAYADEGYPHALWTRLRAETPVAFVETDEYVPFWAVTKQDDIRTVVSQANVFSNRYGISVHRRDTPIYTNTALAFLDPPRHGAVRRAASRRFTNRAVADGRDELERIVVDIVDGLTTDGDEFDFVERVAAPLPIAVISWILGVPQEDWRLVYRWTNEVVGKDDSEFRRPGETPLESVTRARSELRGYLVELIEERRLSPQDDFISHLLTEVVDGAPLTDEEILDYAEFLVEGGNETTRNAISGGLVAFAENPGEWRRLREQPELISAAVEEVLRWSSPVIHLAKVAVQDTEVGGVEIAAGDRMALYYPSGNRDEEHYEDPFVFRLDRTDNPSLVFGFGEHFCLGSHLARLEVAMIFSHLTQRFESIEVTGPVERLRSHLMGSYKRVPTCAVVGTPS